MLSHDSSNHSRFLALFAVTSVFLFITGCGTLSNGRGWGQDAIYPVDLKRIPRAAFHALVDPETLIPVAGALVFGLSKWDKKVSHWATEHNPIFGSEEDAKRASNYLSIPLPVEAVVTALATPSGDDAKDWTASKLKGIAVEGAALGLTAGAAALLQDAINRTRPNGQGNSMPSSHSSTAFSVATLTNRNLESIPLSPEVRIPLYAGNILLATSVAWARVEAGKHYPSDILAGAALGHFLSAFIHDAFLGLPRDKRFIDILPLEKGAMVQLNFTFQSNTVRQSRVIYRSSMANERRLN